LLQNHLEREGFALVVLLDGGQGFFLGVDREKDVLLHLSGPVFSGSVDQAELIPSLADVGHGKLPVV